MQASPGKSSVSQRRGSLRCYAGLDPGAERALVGEDFGARDPFAGEIESNFGEKVLGNSDTEHIIKPPEAIRDITGLRNKKCVPCEGGNIEKLEEGEINRLRLQCPGWKVSKTAQGVECISCDWKVKNFASGLELMTRLGKVADEEGHHPDLHLTGYNNIRAELSTHAVGRLTINDFILAAKLNDLELSDLMPKKKAKFWA
jgi:4a-hydroxytetrahydrobiopterin dehydratase